MNNAEPLPLEEFDNLSTRLFGTADPRYNLMIRYMLIGAARRILYPGCKVDSMLVLVGPQGVGKSTFIVELFGAKYVRSQMPDLSSKDASEALNGFWAIELAELDRVLRTENSTVKEFLTRTFDDYRPPYGRTSERFPRECVFIGTTNEGDILRDATGARRFHPIPVKHVDFQYLRANQMAIWKRAFMLAKEPTSTTTHWFTDDSQLDEIRAPLKEEADAWQESIDAYIQGKECVIAADVYTKAVAKGDIAAVAKCGRRETMRIAAVLRALGCTKMHREKGNVWVVPAEKQARPSASAAADTFMKKLTPQN